MPAVRWGGGPVMTEAEHAELARKLAEANKRSQDDARARGES
ncbi:hypothetical protein [Streptomyces uncialis]|nr:hypothetical protein [Streptomyces uncialis]MCX4664914.1 hypothetical protein [Streptomyces uncialis]